MTPAQPGPARDRRERVIAATGTNRDVLLRGYLRSIGRHVDIAEIELDSGKLLFWPTEYVFREDGSCLDTPPVASARTEE